MSKLVILFFLSLPLLSFALSDEESERRDKLAYQDADDFTQEIEQDIKDFQEKLDVGFIDKFMDGNTKKVISQMRHKNPFEYMSDGQVDSLLLAKGGDLLGKSPRVLKGLRMWLKDKEALSGFLSILGEKEKLKKYGMWMLGVFVCAFFLNLKNSKGGFIKRIFFKLILSMGTFSLNLAIFYFIFQKEIGPTIRVIKKSLLS